MGCLLILKRPVTALSTVEGITEVRELRIRWIGHTLRAEATIVVDDCLTVGQAHDIADHAEAHLLAGVRRLTAATIAVIPASTRRSGA